MEQFAWLEQTALSIWVREEPWVFPTMLVIHSLGMGVVAGVGAAISLRWLGVAPHISLISLSRCLVMAYAAFIANVISGAVLLIAYPAKALTNPVFYIKILLLLVAMGLLKMMAAPRMPIEPSKVVDRRMRLYACIALLSWVGVISAGRLLAYTHSVLLASWMIGG